MIKFRIRMTSAELATMLTTTPQTINRWARAQNWKRRKLKGTRGRGLEIFVNAPVREYLLSTKQLRYVAHEVVFAEETPADYGTSTSDLAFQLQEALTMMTPGEQHRLSELLESEGVSGLLTRLGIAEEDE